MIFDIWIWIARCEFQFIEHVYTQINYKQIGDFRGYFSGVTAIMIHPIYSIAQALCTVGHPACITKMRSLCIVQTYYVLFIKITDFIIQIGLACIEIEWTA